MRTATITISAAAITHNLNQVKQAIPQNTKVLAMVKANAYGHDVANCIAALSDADGLGVATFQEAQEIRDLGWTKSVVLIEGVFSEDEWKSALNAQCQSIIHNQSQVDWAIANTPDNNSPCQTLWLKLNTGMNRIGFEAHEIEAVAQQLKNAGYTLILTSHFANADDTAHPSNQKQIDVFTHVLEQLRNHVDPNIQGSLCNSAGIINFPQCHFDWVRPGIMLYGSSPISTKTAKELNLKQAMRFEARIMAVHDIDKGASVGYGSRFVATKPMVKGIVSIGYGDGYPRVVDDSAWVSVIQDNKHYKCAVIGRVAMDMIAIDLTHVPSPEFGSTVVLWGDSPFEPSVDEVAASANTIGYELLCRVTQRPTRSLV